MVTRPPLYYVLHARVPTVWLKEATAAGEGRLVTFDDRKETSQRFGQGEWDRIFPTFAGQVKGEFYWFESLYLDICHSAVARAAAIVIAQMMDPADSRSMNFAPPAGESQKRWDTELAYVLEELTTHFHAHAVVGQGLVRFGSGGASFDLESRTYLSPRVTAALDRIDWASAPVPSQVDTTW